MSEKILWEGKSWGSNYGVSKKKIMDILFGRTEDLKQKKASREQAKGNSCLLNL